MAVLHVKEDMEVAAYSTDDRVLVFNTALLTPKTSKVTQGVNVLSLKKRQAVKAAAPLLETSIKNPARYRVKTLPAAGALLKEEDTAQQQLSLLE